MTFQKMISVILLLLSVKKLLICDSSLDSELESDLRETKNWGRVFFGNFSAGKIQLASFNCSNISDATDLKCNGSVIEETSP